jgi:hypothetical protein
MLRSLRIKKKLLTMEMPLSAVTDLGFYSLMNKLLNLETERARITEK